MSFSEAGFVCNSCGGLGRQRISDMSTVTEPCQDCGGLGLQDLERLLAEIARAMGKELIRGHAMPARRYRTGRQWVRKESKYRPGEWYSSGESKMEQQVRVYLERAPRGSRPAFILVEKGEA
jgi:hypothetical protein